MFKSIYFGVIWTGTAILFSSISVHAQVSVPFNKAELTIKPEQNPFDYVQNIVENSSRKQQRLGLANASQYDVKSKFNPSLKYRKKYSGSPEQAQAVYNSLVQKYGLPKSVRGESYVWDIKNPSKSAAQADIVTVILKVETSGTYELIMDRDRGGNGRATWDATRVKKQKAKTKLVKQKKTKPLLAVQVDND